MSDPMGDEELLKAIFDEIEVLSFAPDDVVRRKAETVIRAILNAGYRIVKPDDAHSVEFALYCDEDGEGDDISQVAGSYGPRDMAIAEILNATRNYAHVEIEIEEVIRVPVNPGKLFAELESMKEAGE